MDDLWIGVRVSQDAVGLAGEGVGEGPIGKGELVGWVDMIFMLARMATRLCKTIVQDDPPAAGDLLETPLRLYRITDVEPVETLVRCDRWKLRLTVVATRTKRTDPLPELALEAGAHRWTSFPYRAGETPATVWGSD